LISTWVARHMGPVGKAEVVAEELRHQLHNWMCLPEKVDGVLSRIEEGNVIFHSEPSRMPIAIGTMLSAAGGGWLAWSAAHQASTLIMILAAILTGFGFILTLSRS